MTTRGAIDANGDGVEVVADAQALARRGAELVDAWAADDVACTGRCRIALAGGSTPIALYRYWAEHATVLAEALELWYGDERCVPSDHADSNHRAAREALLDPLGVPAANVHVVDGTGPDHAAAAARYAATLPERFDIVLLGMGPDGHTASLFPGDRAALEERERRAFHVVGPKPPPDRITLGAPVLAGARRVLVLAAGAGKAPAIARALDPGTRVLDAPVAIARGRGWLLDTDAAGELSTHER
jgi:6-phosphogluconolactonase